MSEPGDEVAGGGGGRGHLRVSHAERETVVGALKAAFVHGRLAKDELDLRLGQALAARTYADLATITADIPASLTTAQPAASARAQGEQPVLSPGPVITAATVLLGCVWVYAVFFNNGADGPSKPPLIFGSALVYLAILAICLGQLVALRRERRSAGKAKRRPA
jgi:hypothetical protein